MPVALRFDLIKEIVQHGAAAGLNGTADPSTNPILRSAGVAMIAAYIEQMSLIDLVRNPEPIFGSQGGMWIGYSISERGLELSRSEQGLSLAVAALTGGAQNEVSLSVKELRDECERSPINSNYKEDFLRTLEEIAICFDTECYIAVIGLSGKILEVCLKEILIRHKIEFDPNLMIGRLIGTVRDRVPREYVHPALSQLADIINKSRTTAVHAQERVPIPSRDQAVMVIFAMRDVVKRNLTRVNP